MSPTERVNKPWYLYVCHYSNTKNSHLFKRKGNPQVCDNHRSISLLYIAGKILAMVLLNRLNEHLEQSELLPESQCGFRKDRGTIDMIFTAQQLKEICCPAKFIAMVQQFHDWIFARVQNDGEFSDPFPVTNGVKQGCVLASTLFSVIFSAMLTDAFQDGDNDIPIRYHFDGKLFNLRRLQAKSKVQTEVLDEFLFADDMAKGAPSEEKMQKISGSSIWFMWQLWSHNQHQKDWGSISASTWIALQGAYHHRERSKTATGRQVHLPWKHIV